MKHQDSAGNSGVLKEGWVQWMTAGSGVVHSEMPSDEFLNRGGKSEGFQLWVNLPAKDKMIKPRYQDTDARKIPVVTSPGLFSLPNVSTNSYSLMEKPGKRGVGYGMQG